MNLDEIKERRKSFEGKVSVKEADYLIQRIEELEERLAWSAPVSDTYDPDGRMYKELHLTTAKKCAEIAENTIELEEGPGMETQWEVNGDNTAEAIRKEFGLEEA